MEKKKRGRASATEELFRDLAARNCWHQMKRGWPDFFCRRADGSFFVVEVKRRSHNGRMIVLKREQETVMDSLSSVGIECYVSDGISLEVYDKAKHADASRRRFTRKVVIR